MYIKLLEEKWGKLIASSHYISNCPLKFISEDAKLNILFDSSDDIVSIIESKVGTLPVQLKDFYEMYNGCRLFFGSLSIFGIQKYKDDLLKPFELEYENSKNHSEIKGGKVDKLIYFGSLGGDYVVAYDKNERNKVYIFAVKNSTVLKEFDCFNSFFDYYFKKLFDEYDLEGRKIHPDKEYIDIPVIANVTSEI